MLIGVTSWGKECGQNGYPAVFTSVLDYKDWIQEQLNANPLKAPPSGGTKVFLKMSSTANWDGTPQPKKLRLSKTATSEKCQAECEKRAKPEKRSCVGCVGFSVVLIPAGRKGNTRRVCYFFATVETLGRICNSKSNGMLCSKAGAGSWYVSYN